MGRFSLSFTRALMSFPETTMSWLSSDRVNFRLYSVMASRVNTMSWGPQREGQDGQVVRQDQREAKTLTESIEKAREKTHAKR